VVASDDDDLGIIAIAHLSGSILFSDRDGELLDLFMVVKAVKNRSVLWIVNTNDPNARVHNCISAEF
jgi:hypothetical protein